DNGGGSIWVVLPRRRLSSIAMHEPATGIIKHPHWTKQFQDQLAALKTDLKRAGSDQAAVKSAIDQVNAAISKSKEPCDLSEIWITGRFACSIVAKGLLYAAGLVPYAAPGQFAGLEWRTVLFHPLRYFYREDKDRLPLIVVIDRGTWSAAEYFAALLQDNHAALIAGEVSGGAGCGFTIGGIPTELSNSHAQVRLPDCIRFRADGSDEV